MIRLFLLAAALVVSIAYGQVPCNCAYSDAGVALNMEPPVSFCTSTSTQMLQCDEKIYVKNGNDLTPFDSVSCIAGQWYGGCGEKRSALNNANVTVQCGAPEPPMCPQLPSHEGLKYIGTENGLQRYTCGGDDLVRLILNQGRSVHGKYFECNATYYQVSSFNIDPLLISDNEIVDFSCRDYGKIDKPCSVPSFTNVWLRDGILRCKKGYYPQKIGLLDSSNNLITLQSELRSSVARCEAGGWTVVNTAHTGVQLTSFRCEETPNSIGTCGALSMESKNIQHAPFYQQFYCSEKEAQQMLIVTPSGIPYHGITLECVSGVWKFTGTSTVTIPEGSRVSCRPFNMDVLPPEFNYHVGSLSPIIPLAPALIPLEKTPEGLTRWMCLDSTVTLNVEFHADQGKWMPVHAAYIDCNNTFYRFSSSIDYKSSTTSNKIIDISCTDMGPKHFACSDPWDIGGIRKGNRYECMEGFALNSISYVDDQGTEITVSTVGTDTKHMECTPTGWTLPGTSLSGLRVSAFNCYDVSQWSGDSACNALNVPFENYKLQYDYFRKYFTCIDGKIMGYTLDSVQTRAIGKKLYCGKNRKLPEWKWSLMDGTEEAAIPIGAKMSCF